MSYFIATCKYEKLQEDGAIKRVSEKYLCDALSVVEADAMVTKNLKPYISGDFFTSKIENSPIAEVMGDKECGRFWLCKVAFITIDEKTAAEKRTISQILVGAPDFTNAVENFNDGMRGTMADFEIVSLAETPIKEFYQHK
uniref:DUF4494 domain-containing protein n=1 Tax=Dulem virus 40 TaxID=3145758 RepID=A0AAU8AV44_9CAUD